MTTDRLYATHQKTDKDVKPSIRLIRATSPAQVGRYLVRHTIEIRVASQNDIVSALQAGAEVEDATKEVSPCTDGGQS